MMLLRALMPASVMKPTSDATESVPPDRKIAMTPPMIASGMLAITCSASRVDRKWP